MVHAGFSLLLQAEAPDTSVVYVNIGLGFHAELTRAEAQAAARARCAPAQRRRRRPLTASVLRLCGAGTHFGAAVLFDPIRRAELIGKRLVKHDDDLSRIRSHIKLVTEGIRELSNLPQEVRRGRRCASTACADLLA